MDAGRDLTARLRVHKITWIAVLVLVSASWQAPLGTAQMASVPGVIAPPQQTVLPPYVQRGKEVDTQYRAYTMRLQTFYHTLRTVLTREAPDLVLQLSRTPPQAVVYGYQIVPSLIADKPRRAKPARATSTSYSWKRTLTMLDRAGTTLTTAEGTLQGLAGRSHAARRVVYERLISGYEHLEKNQRLIDQHLQYNRFWQREIAAAPMRFAQLTRLHDAVLERQTLHDALHSGPWPEATAALEARVRTLAAQITAHDSRITPPSFLTVHPLVPGLQVIQVPLYTDIQDRQFLAACQQAIEAAWQVADGGTTFRVQVLFKSVNPQHLYRPAPPPDLGAHIDIKAHVARFPTDGGVLTTGANTTYAIPGRYVVLGPEALSSNVLAHEFGHILGFKDGYFRGYRDLGDAGYEVLEVVPDPGDIMHAPERGKVLRAHFDRLIATPAR